MITKETTEHYPLLPLLIGSIIQQIVYDKINLRSNFGWTSVKQMSKESQELTVAVFHITKIKDHAHTN